MNNILSIDLDILFSPYVGIYERFIFDNNPCEFLWETINKYYNISDFIINEKYFQILKNILYTYSQQVKTIYLGNDHSGILRAIQKEKNNLEIPYKFNIYNIDYHHDIVYSDTQQNEILDYNRTSCSNWIGYLNYNKLINKYIWYKGIGSEFNKDFLINSPVIPNNISINLLDNNFPLNLNIDLFFISISPQWIPIIQYNQIKNLLLELPKEKIKHFKYPFFVNENKPDFLSIKGDKINNYFNFN